MKFVRKNLSKILFSFYLLVMPVISLALDVNGVPCDKSGKICNPIPGITSIDGLIAKLLTGAIKIGLPIIALAIIYCGFLFVQARGKPEAISKAREALLYTLIGAAILLGSWAIAQLISSTVTGLS